jgi:hypothetical protein
MTKYRNERPEGHCLYCFPLGWAVIGYGVFTLILSVFACLSLVTEDFRIYIGGYTYWNRALVVSFGFVNLLFALGALLQITENCTYWVRRFAAFLVLRAAVEAIVLALDWRVLRVCERLTMGVGELASHGDGEYYNGALAAVVITGQCAATRQEYLFWALLDIVVSLAGAYHINRWCHLTDDHPCFTISLGNKAPVYSGYSDLGLRKEAEYAQPPWQQQWKTHEVPQRQPEPQVAWQQQWGTHDPEWQYMSPGDVRRDQTWKSHQSHSSGVYQVVS